MREREIERKFVSEVKRQGGLALKFVSPGYDGMPDRIALLPDGKFAFVELKAPGKYPRALQEGMQRVDVAVRCLIILKDSTQTFRQTFL